MGCTSFGNINVEVFGTNEITVHLESSFPGFDGGNPKIFAFPLDGQIDIYLEGIQDVYLEGSFLTYKGDHYVPLEGELGLIVELEGCVYLQPLT